MLPFWPEVVYKRDVRRKAWSIDRIAGFGVGAGRVDPQSGAEGGRSRRAVFALCHSPRIM